MLESDRSRRLPGQSVDEAVTEDIARRRRVDHDGRSGAGQTAGNLAGEALDLFVPGRVDGFRLSMVQPIQVSARSRSATWSGDPEITPGLTSPTRTST
ncbi:hypothetical protein [Dactylosporangium sp. NPDC050588]|uniref:hypothetical protein n=1 Tax=Dactylosporangium sp. NPDC050588 TaxID=3157211 RepID=UPI0033FF3745